MYSDTETAVFLQSEQLFNVIRGNISVLTALDGSEFTGVITLYLVSAKIRSM